MVSSRELVAVASGLGALLARIERARDGARELDASCDAKLQDILDAVEADLARAAKRVSRAAGRVGDLFAVDACNKDHTADARQAS